MHANDVWKRLRDALTSGSKRLLNGVIDSRWINRRPSLNSHLIVFVCHRYEITVPITVEIVMHMIEEENSQCLASSVASEPSIKVRKRILLNVGGRLFETWEDNFNNHPDTLLGSSEKELYYNSLSKAYVFDRDPQMFRHILNYYR